MTRLARVGAAALAGTAATLALIASPLFASLGPILVPYVPIDVRWVVLPAAFALLQLVSEHVRWPAPATGTLAAGATSAVLANLHASQVLTFLGVGWAQPGMQVDLLALAASLAALGLGLWIAFDAARERFNRQIVDRGLAPADVEPTSRWARSRARETIAVAGVAVAVLALVVRLSGGLVGATSMPLPGLAAIGLVLALGALMLGLPGLPRA